MARDFNGTSSDIINCGSSVPDLTGNWTIAGWFWRTSNTRTGSGNTDAVWSRWTNSGANRQVYIYIARNDVANSNAINVDVPFVAAIMVGGTPTIQVWHQFTITRSGNVWTAYLDGSQSNQVTSATSQETGGSAYIGGTDPGVGALGEGHFLGKLAEFAIWDAALTADEAQSLGKGLSPSKIRSQSLQGYWPLIGHSSPEPDLKATHNGTVTGTTAANDHPPIFGF